MNYLTVYRNLAEVVRQYADDSRMTVMGSVCDIRQAEAKNREALVDMVRVIYDSYSREMKLLDSVVTNYLDGKSE